jgi:hypothetical protein
VDDGQAAKWLELESGLAKLGLLDRDVTAMLEVRYPNKHRLSVACAIS